MPKYKITDSKTGKTLQVTGDSPPTDQEKIELFASFETPDEGFEHDPILAAAGLSPSDFFGGGQARPLAEKREIAERQRKNLESFKGQAPRLQQAQAEGAGVGQQLISGGLDVLSFPGRAIASAPALLPGGESPLEAMARTKGKEREGVLGKVAQFGGDIVRDPAAAITAGTSGAIGTAKGLGAKVLQGIGIGAREGIESAAVHQLEKVGRGEDVDLGEAGTEALFSTATGGALPVIGAGARGTSRIVNKNLGRLSEELSGVSEEALRKFGTGFGEGAQDLAAASKTQRKVGDKILDALDNFDEFLPEKESVDKALQNMPEVNIAKTVQALEDAKPLGKIGKLKEVPGEIDTFISDLIESAGPDGAVDAITFRKLRQEFDINVGDAFGKDESSALVGALKKARHQMAESLVETAEGTGNIEYSTAMRSMADKMRVIDDLKGYIGKSDQARNRKIEGFIDNLFGKNKSDQQRVISELSEILGEDLIEETKLAQLASQLGPEGKAGFIPTQTTGRSKTGFGLAAGQIGAGVATGQPALVASGIGTGLLSAPRTAAGTLAAVGGVERALPDLQTLAAPEVRAALRGLSPEDTEKLAKGKRK